MKRRMAETDKMFDGDNNTYYHSKYGDGVDAAVKEYPHNIYVDFGSQKSFQSLRYQQRVDQNGNSHSERAM